MSRFAGYIVILCGLVLLFNMFGLSEGETGLVKYLLHPEIYPQWPLFIMVGAIVTILIGVGAVSLITGGSFKIDFISIAAVGMVGLLLGLLAELLSIFSTIADGSKPGALLIFSPLFILWIITTLEWWRGVN